MMNDFKCKTCLTNFQNENDFIKHLKTHVNKNVEDKNPKDRQQKKEYKCKDCDKSFMANNNLKILAHH